jgi:hypothetical protein
MSLPSTDQVSEDTLLRLEVAAKIAFPLGGMGVSGLRREAGRGNLRIYKMANKDFTTLRDINGMREKCRATPNQPASGLNPKRETRQGSSKGAQHGSFETERKKSALDALRQTARGLNKPSKNTSSENIRSHETAAVIRLKS